MDEGNNKSKAELHKELGSYWASQSTKTSENGRKIIWAIIGTIWFLVYDTKDKNVTFVNDYLPFAIVGAFVYLAFDYFQYFFISIYYFNRCKDVLKTDENNSVELEKIEKDAEGLSTNSCYLHKAKAIILAITIIAFILSLLNIANLF